MEVQPASTAVGCHRTEIVMPYFAPHRAAPVSCSIGSIPNGFVKMQRSDWESRSSRSYGSTMSGSTARQLLAAGAETDIVTAHFAVHRAASARCSIGSVLEIL